MGYQLDQGLDRTDFFLHFRNKSSYWKSTGPSLYLYLNNVQFYMQKYSHICYIFHKLHIC